MEVTQTVCAERGVRLSPLQLNRLATHYREMVAENRRINLTRITDPAEAAVKHYADSLALLMWASKEGVEVLRLLDVGTGAGFPSVPLAVARPGWLVTAIDSTRKKIVFLRKAITTLGIDNLRAEHGHAQHWRPTQSFDLVVARAVANLAVCLESAARHVRPGGWIVVYKTASIPTEEVDAAERLLYRYDLRAHEPFSYELPCGTETLRRRLYLYQKQG